MQRLGCAGGRRNHGNGRGPGAAQILVREVQDHLIVGVGMDSSHGSADNLELVIHHFRDRGETVGGAGGVGNNVMRRRVVGLVVYAKDEGGVGAIGGRGDDDFFDRGAEMLLGVNTLGEEPGGFDDDVRANRSPINFGGIFSLENLEASTFHGDGVISMRHLVRQIPEDGIVLQKVRESLRVGDVVDRDKLNVLVVDCRTHDIATDAAEAVDANLDGHSSSDELSEIAAVQERMTAAGEQKMLGVARRKVNARKTSRYNGH